MITNGLRLAHAFRSFLPIVYIHQSAIAHTFDKYNFAKKTSRKIQKRINKKSSRGTEVFQLDPLCRHDTVRVESVRQKTMGNALQDSINAILASRDVPVELQSQFVEVTEVKVKSDSSCAAVRWKVENKEKELLVGKLLRENVDRIRMILPTYHHLTHTPTIHFEKDKKDSYLHRLDMLLNSCSPEDSGK